MHDILLVDDEEGIRKVMGISLADRGFKVYSAGDGPQALSLFESVRPPIVLTDIKMPGMDGIDLLKALKKIDPDVEVIMVTGHGDIDLAIRSLKFDATDFITKPIDDDVLDVALKRAGDRIRMRAQLRAYTQNLEELVEKKSRQLVQAERLAAVGETVAGLAHAIKNISSGLKGGAFVVEKGLSLENAVYLRQGWQMVRDNVDRIQQLALDLLNISKPGAPNFKMIDPNEPLEAVFRLVQPQADQFGLGMRLETAPDGEPVRIDPESMHRCLLNLVTNALDACAQAGGCAAQPAIVLSCARSDQSIEYRISDLCGGMPPEVENRIFQGFFTTKGSRGTGIGLMLSRKIVEAHQGAISVETRLGQGSVFTIRLPLRTHAGRS